MQDCHLSNDAGMGYPDAVQALIDAVMSSRKPFTTEA
jgi:hypothetical protein